MSPYCQVLGDQGYTAPVHELPPGLIVTAGGPRPPGLPVAAYRSEAFRRSAGILPWSCHFAPLSRSKGERGRPTDQAASICHDGLERIGPPAGDLGPATACPAGPAAAARAEAGLGMVSRSWSPAGSGCSWSAPVSATRHLPRIDQVDGRYLSTDGA